MANSNNINIDEIRELLNERLNYFSDEINKAIRSGLSSKKVAELIRNQEQNILDKFNVRSIEELDNLKLSIDKQIADKQREIDESFFLVQLMYLLVERINGIPFNKEEQ